MHRLHDIDVNTEIVHQLTVVIKVVGEVDMSNVQMLSSAIDESMPNCFRGLVIDLTSTDFIDSMGISTILSAYQTMRDWGGKLMLVTSNPNIKRTLRLINVERIPDIMICSNVADATRVLAGL